MNLGCSLLLEHGIPSERLSHGGMALMEAGGREQARSSPLPDSGSHQAWQQCGDGAQSCQGYRPATLFQVANGPLLSQMPSFRSARGTRGTRPAQSVLPNRNQ